ncbi:MAG: thiamine phosphate synthase, partial [Ferruginibacter sp.]|nr:thiamine phosphate synthase [Rhodoferax sp.]
MPHDILNRYAAMALPATDEAVRLNACLQLGFIPADAACIAQAWHAQAVRTGNTTDWPDYPQDFGLRPWPRSDTFPACPQQLGLYAVLPDAAWVGRMARAGVPTVQLRFKSDDAEAIAREVAAAVSAVQGTPALLFINDHWQAAIHAGAYGVHLGQEDLDLLQPADLDAIRRAGLRLGVSTHGYAEMLR